MRTGDCYTGAANGYSSWTLLPALERNGAGRLYSLDASSAADHLPVGCGTGWLVPEDLCGRWELVRGRNLGGLLSRAGPVGIFLHDSDHRAANQNFEFRTSWPHLSDGGLLAADDVGASSAFEEFAGRTHGTRFVLDRRLGLLLKPTLDGN